MSDPVRRREYWCLRCGSPATYLTESMDPNRPIGLCRAGAKNHDRGIVTPDRDEVERLLAEIAETKHKIARERRAVRGYTIGSIEP